MRSVLLIDDDEDYREAVIELLQEEGFSVQAAADGTAGLELLARAPELPGLVLLDVRMLGMSGDAFLAIARETYPDLVVVVVSGHAKTLPLADGTLPKPVSSRDLVSVVREFCGDEKTAMSDDVRSRMKLRIVR